MFNQVEGLCVDEGVTFADLKGVLMHFARRFFGEEIRRAPAAVVLPVHRAVGGDRLHARHLRRQGLPHVQGHRLDRDRRRRHGRSRACSAHVGYDSEKYSGFAFGWGIDRMAMLKYGVDNIKRFFEGDVRFARQFR